MTRFRLLPAALALAILSGVFAPTAIGADDNEAIRKKVLELNKLTGEDTLRAKAIELIKDKANSKKMLQVADDMAKLDSKQFTYNAAWILGLVARQFDDKDVALRFFRICEKKAREIKSGTKLADALDNQIRIYMAKKDYEGAEKLSRKTIGEKLDDEFENAKILFFETMVQAMTKQGKVDEALERINSLIESNPDGWFLYQLKGGVLQEAGKPAEAEKAYRTSIEKIEKNDQLKPDIQKRLIERNKYILSNVYIELNQVDKAAQELKDLLKQHPDNSTYNNDLGYVWADHDQNLDEAEKMIRKALKLDREARKKQKDLLPEEDKDNGAYLDSLGWVLYKKKNYAEAKKYLLEAISTREGQGIEILDHLADVYMALGQKDEAIKTWQKAIDQDLSSRRDFKRRAEVIKKIKAAQGKK